MPEEQAPPVVAVVVASDPARWFEDCLEAFADQDYPNLDVLVVDAASHEELTARVAAVLPRAFVHRQSDNRGFSAAANEALTVVQGATHLLVCHDDVAPAPDAVRRMVEEAYRSNAAIVGPKLVMWDAPDRLLQVGLGVDHLGGPLERVEAGELDQGQHDEVREVFAVPGGCTLVRADLFQALGGFDPDMDLFGEDVDLCWRAQVAGARVVVAPSARVRHLQAAQSGLRQVGDIVLLRRSHQLRAVFKDYGLPRRARFRVQLAAMSAGELLVAFGKGDRVRARRVRASWRWNLSHRRSLRDARRAVARVRQQPDRVVARLFTASGRRSAPADGHAGPPSETGPAKRELLPPLRLGSRRYPVVPRTNVGWAVAVLVAVVVFGVRNLFAGHLPLVGELLPFPAASTLLRELWSGWSDAGWQTTGPAPSAFGIVGLAGSILLGSTAQVEKLLLLGPILVGGVGIHRLLRPFGSSRARLAGTIAYLGFPLVWNDIAAGDLMALVAFAGMPFVLIFVGRATRLAPFRSAHDATGWRGVVSDVVPFGLLLAVMAALAPPTVVAVAAVSVGIVLGSVAAGRVGAAVRAAGVTIGAVAFAFVCCLPWSITFVQRGARWSILAGAVSSPQATTGILRLLRFAVGPIGAGWLGWGLLLGAGFVLLVARDVRLDWATRWWVAAIATVAVAYAGSIGWLGAGGGATLVLLAPAACCLAAAVGLGVAAFEVDLARSRFGWRQNLSVGAALCLVVGLFPTLVSMVDGRSSLPSVGYEQLLGWTEAGHAARGYQVLWLGDPASLPLSSWQMARGLAFAPSVNGLPDGRRLWPSANPGLGTEVENAVTRAEAGLTVRLGASLARAGIRYVLVPEAVAPTLPGVQVPPSIPPPPALAQALEAQSDLRQLPTEGGVMAFENTAWPVAGSPFDDSVVGLGSAPGRTPQWLRQLGLVGGLVAFAAGAAACLVRRRRRNRAESAPPSPDDATDGGGAPKRSRRRPASERRMPDGQQAELSEGEPEHATKALQ